MRQPIDLTDLLNRCPNVMNVTVCNAHQQVSLGPNSANLSSFSLSYKFKRGDDDKFCEFDVSNLRTSTLIYNGNGNLRGSTTVDAFTHLLKNDGANHNNGARAPGDTVTIRTAFHKATQYTNCFLEISNTHRRPTSYATNIVMMPLATFTYKRTCRKV